MNEISTLCQGREGGGVPRDGERESSSKRANGSGRWREKGEEEGENINYKPPFSFPTTVEAGGGDGINKDCSSRLPPPPLLFLFPLGANNTEDRKEKASPQKRKQPQLKAVERNIIAHFHIKNIKRNRTKR